MARPNRVTRTIQTTKATVLMMNLDEREPFNEVYTLPRTYKDEDSILKSVSKRISNPAHKAVAVVDVQVVETLYGMSEEKFIEMAEILPPRSATTDEAE